jgi:hypothetical protein
VSVRFSLVELVLASLLKRFSFAQCRNALYGGSILFLFSSHSYERLNLISICFGWRHPFFAFLPGFRYAKVSFDRR